MRTNCDIKAICKIFQLSRCLALAIFSGLALSVIAARCQLPQSGSPWQSTQSSSLCQGLSLWERWICEAKTERASPLKSKSSRLRADNQKAPRTSDGNAGRFGDTGCMPYASGWGCAAEDWAAMNSAASSGMSSKSSSLPMSTLSGGFLNRISYRIGTIYRVIRVA